MWTQSPKDKRPTNFHTVRLLTNTSQILKSRRPKDDKMYTAATTASLRLHIGFLLNNKKSVTVEKNTMNASHVIRMIDV